MTINIRNLASCVVSGEICSASLPTGFERVDRAGISQKKDLYRKLYGRRTTAFKLRCRQTQHLRCFKNSFFIAYLKLILITDIRNSMVRTECPPLRFSPMHVAVCHSRVVIVCPLISQGINCWSQGLDKNTSMVNGARILCSLCLWLWCIVCHGQTIGLTPTSGSVYTTGDQVSLLAEQNC